MYRIKYGATLWRDAVTVSGLIFVLDSSRPLAFCPDQVAAWCLNFGALMSLGSPLFGCPIAWITFEYDARKVHYLPWTSTAQCATQLRSRSFHSPDVPVMLSSANKQEQYFPLGYGQPTMQKRSKALGMGVEAFQC